MAANFSFVADAKTGPLWSKSITTKSVPLPASYTVNDGATGPLPLLTIVDAASHDPKDIARAAKFGCIAFRSTVLLHSEDADGSFNSSTVHGYPGLATVDQRGHIYVYDLDNARFDLVAKIGIAGTAVALGVLRPFEVIIACSDRSLHCYNIDTLKPVAKLPDHHKSIVRHVSVHPFISRVLTTSDTETILWDSDDWSKLLLMGGASSPQFHQSMFSPNGELIISAFQDDSLVVWDAETLTSIWRIDSETVDAGAVPMGITCFAVARDNSVLVTGGWTTVQVWDLHHRCSIRELEDPLLLKGILEVQFVGDSTMVVVLTTVGDLLFMDTSSGFIKPIANLLPVRSFSISADGKAMAVHPVDSPSTVTLWSIHELIVHENTPSVLPTVRDSPAERKDVRRSMSFRSRRSPSVSSVGSGGGGGGGGGGGKRLSGASYQVPASPSAGRVSFGGQDKQRAPSPNKRRSQTFSAGPSHPRRQGSQSNIQAPGIERHSGVYSRTSMGSTSRVMDSLSRAKSMTATPHEPRQPISAFPYVGHQLIQDPKPRTPSARPSSRESEYSMSSTGSTLTVAPLLNDLDLNNLREADVALIYKSLEKFVKKKNAFPADYRLVIWKFLLKLPENQLVYDTYCNMGEHPCVRILRDKIKLSKSELRQTLEQTMSCVAHWAPQLGEMGYLPYLFYPFIKLFQSEPLQCFEIVVTMITNWFQDWWTSFPNPPTHTLAAIEKMLQQYDAELAAHFAKIGANVALYAWLPLRSLFSETLVREDWLCLWDNCFSRQPRFLYFFTVAFLVCSRKRLFAISNVDDLREFFYDQQEVDMKIIIKVASKFNVHAQSAASDAFAYHVPFHPLPRTSDTPDATYPSLETMVAAGHLYSSRSRSSLNVDGAIKEEDEALTKRFEQLRSG